MKIYDLSVTISEELAIYTSDPCVEIKPHTAISKGAHSNVDRVSFGTHTGTHADMPKHFIDDGLTCENVGLDRFFGQARVLDLRYALSTSPGMRKIIEPEDLKPYDIQPDEIILLNTGCSSFLREKKFRGDYAVLSEDAAEYLAERRIKTVGLDSLSVDAFGSKGFPVHHILLSQGITIIEGLYFDGEPVPQDSYTLSALPLKLANGNGCPVRAILASEFKPKAVLFDMDGVIVDTEPMSREGWRTAFHAQGYTNPDELYESIVGTNRAGCRARLTAALGENFNYDAVQEARNDYVHNYRDKHGVELKKGVVSLLDVLDELGIPCCVATSTDKFRAEELLNSKGIGKRFKKIVGGDGVKNGKPDPEIYLKAAAEMNARPEECVAIEDSRLGTEAAFRGGIRVILVPDLQAPDENTYARAFAVCKDLDEAAKLISRVSANKKRLRG